MSNHRRGFYGRLLCGTAAISLLSAAAARAEDQTTFNIAPQPLSSALNEFATQSKTAVLFTPELTGKTLSPGLTEVADAETALRRMLVGTGLGYRRNGDTFIIMRADDPQGGSAAGDGAGTVEALIVTAQKREEDIQDVPIAISAFSQEDLERSQIAGGPDLITQVPNMSFTKTNFSSYSVQIRGIGTQAISATTDPAVAIAFNNTPFIRNRFFEQEFYDLQRLEVLRGPQGTLYGRNATAGVVNIISQKPKFSFESKLSADVSNYSSTRLEGMVNIPLVEDKVALRLAGAWTKRQGYATNQMTGEQIDGRDLWSGRVSLRFEPTDALSANFIYEHFEENDDRLRSGKQLCKKNVVTQIGDLPVPEDSFGGYFGLQGYISQGCEAVSLYSDEAFQTPNGYALPFYGPTRALGGPVFDDVDPYASEVQSRDLRVIESSVEPDYRANADLAELQVAFDITPSLTLASETAFSADSVFSLQDYNRFTTKPGAFDKDRDFDGTRLEEDGSFCDPQLGCSDRVLLVDLSTSESTQFSQEFRLSSDFDAPVNFSLGANYLRHDTIDKYYVFVNTLTAFKGSSGVFDNSQSFPLGDVGDSAPAWDPYRVYSVEGNVYTDPNPIGSLNDEGRNYFLSKNPYKLISYAAFGELYYNIAPTLKLTGGLRFTVDKKTAPQVPSWVLASGATGPYPVGKTVVQEWREPTGRLTLDWKPDLSFTDETLIYGSYAHGYKAGGANPPPPVLVLYFVFATPVSLQEVLPDTFDAEFVDAYEIGTKNTLFDGALTLNLTGFYYDYTGYQTSEIRNRSAVNSNFDAEVWGVEVEADWRPLENLRFGLKAGYNGTRLADGSSAIDLMDRTAGNEDWVVIRPFPTIPSNCILPVSVATAGGTFRVSSDNNDVTGAGPCQNAYYAMNDPVTGLPYDPDITDYTTAPTRSGSPLGPDYADYPGFDPASAPNGGMGFSKDLSGNELPNAPNHTVTLTADYTLPLPNEWLVTLHGDYHWQSESWGRVINSDPFDRIEDFSLVNLAAIFTNEDAGWKVMAYVKNVLDETAITGTFLNSDDTGLTTNVFLTEPRLYGLRVTKEWNGGGAWWSGENHKAGEPYALTAEIGAGINRFEAENARFSPAWMDDYSDAFPMPNIEGRDLDWGDSRDIKLTYAPAGSAWRVSGAYRFGRTNGHHRGAAYEAVEGGDAVVLFGTVEAFRLYYPSPDNHWRGGVKDREEFNLIDFAVGREVGFGAWGEGGKSLLSLGLRHAQFKSMSHMQMAGVPDRDVPADFFPFKYATHPQVNSEHFLSILDSQREFEGTGPTLNWDAAVRLWGNEEIGHADLEWSLGGGVMFGKQEASSSEERTAIRYRGGAPAQTDSLVVKTPLYDEVLPLQRTDDANVPTFGASLGLSYGIDRVKVSTGYRYDRFFDVIDGGYDEAKTYDRVIHGPYLKLSIGFGG